MEYGRRREDREMIRRGEGKGGMESRTEEYKKEEIGRGTKEKEREYWMVEVGKEKIGMRKIDKKEER